ncbi:MAG TPA: MBL fold metallo-hydrolase [Candidatus Dormibacteraeota bacterium]|nr:MBL fold metallo-hydrolase [Candidatus Dormibacteraeota bacterium]
MSASHCFEPSTAVGDGIVQIRLPMTGNPLRYVNGYLVADDGGYTLIDCGWRSDDVLEALQAGLARAGVTIAQIRRVVVTHFHHDHYGLSATLRRAGVPELLMHSADWSFARSRLGRAPGDRDLLEWLARNGFETRALADDDERRERSELAEPTACVEDGQRVGRLQVVWTPGHTPGHVCLVDTLSRRVFTGDHVLDPITPHVGVWGADRSDPLGTYLDSLRKIGAVAATGALPAHGEPFADLHGRVDELLGHHGVREEAVLGDLRRGQRNAAEIARSLPWTRRGRTFDELSEMHQQFAVAETIAHLEHLWARRLVAREAAAQCIVYSAAAEGIRP